MCLACNANYQDYVTANGDGSYTLHINEDTCTNLKKACYPYLKERVASGSVVKGRADMKDMMKKKEKVKKKFEEMEDCANTDAGCTDAEQKVLIEGMDKVMTEDSEASKTVAEKKERIKAVQGDVNMVVTMPDGCTSETNCEYICTKMVDYRGAKDEAADLTTLEDPEGDGRRLAADTITTTYTASGYEADSTANS